MTPAELMALAQQLLYGCRDPVTGERLSAGLPAEAIVEDVEEAARYLRACAEAEPVATVRVHDTGGNAGIAWSGVPTENAGVMRGGTPLYTCPQPPSEQAEVANDSKWLGPFTTASEALNELRMAIATMMGCDQSTWPDHGNAPLAIAAAFAIRQTALEERAPEQDDVRAAPQATSAQPTLTAEIVEAGTPNMFWDEDPDGDGYVGNTLQEIVEIACDDLTSADGHLYVDVGCARKLPTIAVRAWIDGEGALLWEEVPDTWPWGDE